MLKYKKKALLMSLCAVLFVAISVFGTMAYLTDQESATNTFTVGAVAISLDETDVKLDGTKDTDARVTENTYHLIPGHTYIKDPTVTVAAKSENSYVRMIVEVEGMDQLEAALPNGGSSAKYYDEDGLFLLQELCVDQDNNNTWDSDNWKWVGYTQESGSTTGAYEFRYVGNDPKKPDNGIVVKSDTATILPALFKSITVPGEINNTNLEKLADVQIHVTAHAIQADGFSDAVEAWNNFN